MKISLKYIPGFHSVLIRVLVHVQGQNLHEFFPAQLQSDSEI